MLRVDIEKVHFNMFNSNKPFEGKPKYNRVEVIATSVKAVTTAELMKEIYVLHEKKNQEKMLTKPPSMRRRQKLYLKRQKRHGIIANAPVEPPHMPTSDDTNKKRIKP